MKAFFAKWGICLLLLAATTLNYLDRQTISILAPTIQQELRLNNEDLGWLFSVFYYSYTFAQFGIGPLLDRFSLRWLFGGAVVAWSLVCALTGLANSFAMLIAFRLLLGIAESANWPGAMRIVARALPPHERALGNGIFTSGTSVGALIAPAVILGVSSLVGWRASFAVLGSFGLLWFAFWVLSTRSETQAHIWLDPQPAPRSASSAYAAILRAPQFWRVFCVTILVNPILYFFLNWLPTYYKQQHGIGQGPKLAAILTFTYLGLDLGYLVCGTAVLLLVKRAGVPLRTARRIVFTGATLLLCGVAFVPAAPGFDTVVTLLLIANFAIGIWIAMYLTMAQEVHSASVSTAAGLLGGSGSLAGAFLMWAVGRVTQITGSFSIPFFAVTTMALMALLAGWIASRATQDHPSTPAMI